MLGFAARDRAAVAVGKIVISSCRTRRAALLLGAPLLFSSLTACTMTVTDQVGPCSTPGCVSKPGTYYSLPIGRFQLKATRVSAASQVGGATTALQAARDTFNTDSQALAKAVAGQAKDAADKSTTQAAKDADDALVKTAQTIVDADSKLLKAAQDNLDKVTAASGTGVESFTLQQLSVAADPNTRFVTNLDHSLFRDDTLQIDMTDGLLTSVSASSTDQSLNALVKLAETGISLASFAASGVPLIPASDNKEGGAKAPGSPSFSMACTYDIQETFDPLNPADIWRVNSVLKGVNASFRLSSDKASTVGDIVQLASDITKAQDDAKTEEDLLHKAEKKAQDDALLNLPKDQDAKKRADDEAARQAAQNNLALAQARLEGAKRALMDWNGPPAPRTDVPSHVKGIVYRVPTSVLVSAKAEDGPDATYWADGGPQLPDGTSCPLMAKPASQSVLAVVPDSRSNYYMETDIGAFTNPTLSYKFTSGMLTEYSTTRPSEFAAPIVALNKLANDIIAIPGGILKLRLDYTNSSADLAKAQATLATNQGNRAAAALSAQSAIADAHAALVKAQFGDAQAWADAQKSLLTAEQALQTLGAPVYQSPYPVPTGPTPGP